MDMNYVEHPFNMGMFYQLKVSFNMGTSLDTHIRAFSYWSRPPGGGKLEVESKGKK